MVYFVSMFDCKLCVLLGPKDGPLDFPVGRMDFMADQMSFLSLLIIFSQQNKGINGA